MDCFETGSLITIKPGNHAAAADFAVSPFSSAFIVTDQADEEPLLGDIPRPPRFAPTDLCHWSRGIFAPRNEIGIVGGIMLNRICRLERILLWFRRKSKKRRLPRWVPSRYEPFIVNTGLSWFFLRDAKFPLGLFHFFQRPDLSSIAGAVNLDDCVEIADGLEKIFIRTVLHTGIGANQILLVDHSETARNLFAERRANVRKVRTWSRWNSSLLTIKARK